MLIRLFISKVGHLLSEKEMMQLMGEKWKILKEIFKIKQKFLLVFLSPILILTQPSPTNNSKHVICLQFKALQNE